MKQSLVLENEFYEHVSGNVLGYCQSNILLSANRSITLSATFSMSAAKDLVRWRETKIRLVRQLSAT